MMTLPIGISLLTWAHALVIDFPTDNIPYLYDEENWKDWGNYLVQTRTFVNNGAPAPYNYADWQKWAQDVYYTISNVD